jgi:hypothetical protein
MVVGRGLEQVFPGAAQCGTLCQAQRLLSLSWFHGETGHPVQHDDSWGLSQGQGAAFA